MARPRLGGAQRLVAPVVRHGDPLDEGARLRDRLDDTIGNERMHRRPQLLEARTRAAQLQESIRRDVGSVQLQRLKAAVRLLHKKFERRDGWRCAPTGR